MQCRIDYVRFVWQLLPPVLRSSVLLVLLRVLITPLRYLQERLSAYMEGVRCVGPKKGSLYASIEPVSAAVFSALLMGARFTGMDLLGFACILSTIFLLAMDKKD